jgi:hypothetical protein
MVTPEVVGRIGPAGWPGSKTNGEARESAARSPWLSFVPRQEYDDSEPADASRFLTGLVTCLATHGGIPAAASAARRR